MSDLGNNIIRILEIDEEGMPILPNQPVEVKQEEPVPQVPAVIDVAPRTAEEDVNLAQENLKRLINQGFDSLTKLAKVAEDSEHPRAYEVLATFLQTVAGLNKDLVVSHKQKIELTNKENPNPDLRPPGASGNVHVQNAVFVGSTKDLQMLMKQQPDANGNISK